MEQTKKYTVITGASSGIGYETAKAFAERGKNLIVAARRTENLEALKCEITERLSGYIGRLDENDIKRSDYAD